MVLLACIIGNRPSYRTLVCVGDLTQIEHSYHHLPASAPRSSPLSAAAPASATVPATRPAATHAALQQPLRALTT